MDDPFENEAFQSWLAYLTTKKVNLVCIVEVSKDMTLIKTVGDNIKDPMDALTVDSMNWLVPPRNNFVLLHKPLKDFYRDFDKTKKEGAMVLRQFMAKGQCYGNGDCLLWDFQARVKSLHLSRRSIIMKRWYKEYIKLSDVIEWKAFKIPAFGKCCSKCHQYDYKAVPFIQGSPFKIFLTYREFYLLLIEIGYAAMGLCPNTFLCTSSSIPILQQLHNNDDVDFNPFGLPILQKTDSVAPLPELSADEVDKTVNYEFSVSCLESVEPTFDD